MAEPTFPVAQGPSPELEDPASAYRWRSQFRRYGEPGTCYIVTTNTHERRPIFLDPHLCHIILEDIRFYRDRLHFRLHAYVIMPDHVHLLMTTAEAALSDIMRDVKSYTAKRIRETLAETGPVWQARFHDGGIRTEQQFLAAMEYIHQNPVKAALAESAEGYDFSSARAYSGSVSDALAIDLPDGSRLGP